VAGEVSRLMGVTLEVPGETGELKAEALVSELLRTGFAEKL